MKKTLLFLLIVCSLFAISASAQTKVRVNFDKNKFEKTIFGSIKGSSYIEYSFRVKQYFFIEADLKSGSKYLKFTITDPKGEAIQNGTNVIAFTGEAGKTGYYIIRVTNKSSNSQRFGLRIAAFMGT